MVSIGALVAVALCRPMWYSTGVRVAPRWLCDAFRRSSWWHKTAMREGQNIKDSAASVSELRGPSAGFSMDSVVAFEEKMRLYTQLPVEQLGYSTLESN